MGQEIVYCHKCQKRILGTDFAKRTAFKVAHQVTCAGCAMEVLSTLPTKEREELLAQMSAPQTAAGPSGTSDVSVGLRASSSAKHRALPAPSRPAARSNRTLSLSLVGIGLAILIVILAVALGGSSGRRASTGPEPQPIAAPSPAPISEESRRSAAAREEIRKAFEFAKAHPQDLDGQISAWRDALLSTDRTPSAGDAKRELDRLLARRKEASDRAWSDLVERARATLEREEFSGASDMFRSARGQFDAPEWTLQVDQKLEEIRRTACDLLPALKEKAAASQKRGAADEVKSIRERVAKWGFPDLAVDLEAALAAAPASSPAASPAPASAPAPVQPPKEGGAPFPQWEAALARATRSDFAGAAQELSAAIATLADPAQKSAAAEDLEAIRRVGAAIEETRDIVAKAAKGQKLSLERWDEAGRPEKIEGTVAGSEASRVLLKQESGITGVVVGEIMPASIAELFLSRPARKPEADARTAVLICLLGGDLEGARKLAERQKAQLPARFWTYGEKLATAPIPVKEVEARRRFHEAEEASWDPRQAGAAIEAQKTLLRDYGDTAFVARNRATIVARSAIGKEFLFFPSMMTGAGSFKLTGAGKMELAWLSDKDSDASAIAQNFVEFSFFATPATEYRLWIFAAGCCQETFTFGVQGTEMVLPSARTTATEPGGGAFVTVKPPVSLKKTHASHLGPKNPAHWEWVPVALPKYSAPGVKVVRILTDHKGFAFAYALVSSISSSAPRESEVKELEKIWSQRRGALSTPDPAAPDLVGFWPFDEGTGTKSADASGKSGPAILKGTTWTAGRSGAGLLFDGQNSHAELPRTPALDRLHEGSYTLAAWYRPERLPPGKDDANDAADGIILRAGYHSGIVYCNTGAFSLMHWLLDPNDSNKGLCASAGTKAFPPGAFYHVVGVVDRAAGTHSLYVNGKLEGAAKFAANATAWRYGPAPWRVGIGGPDDSRYRWPVKGVIDDVRIYSRALSEAEVGLIFRAKGPARPAVNPAAGAADARPWRRIFDGESVKFLSRDGGGAWLVKDGVIVHTPGVDDAARTHEDFVDGEFRIRFDGRALSNLWFAIRHTGEGSYMASIAREAPDALKGEHELLFTCLGENVTATLDGKPFRLEKTGNSRMGALQFNCDAGGSLAIRAIEMREPK